ncbi:MAG: YihY/virulence factor BrkB family protein [Planctomycetaceae bacterium]
MKNPFANLPRTWNRFNDDNGSLLAAGVAYYGALSFFPLLLTLISGVGLVLQFTSAGQNAEAQLLETVGTQFSPALQDHVATAMEQVRDGAGTSGPIGLITLMFGAMAIFIQFENAFDVIWNVEAPESKGALHAVKRVMFQRLLAFVMLAGLGVLLLAILVCGIALSVAADYSKSMLPRSDILWASVQHVLPVVLNTAVFSLIYRWLPKPDVRWSEALQGALFAGIVWEIGRNVLTHFLVGSTYSSAYGVVGSFIAVLLWIYYAVTVLFLGAEYIQCICQQCSRTA